MVAALRARSFVDVTFTTPMIFFTHHRLVTRPMIRTIMDAAEAFITDELAALDVIGSKPAPTQQSIKVRVFAGLRAAGFDVAGLEAAYAAIEELERAASAPSDDALHLERLDALEAEVREV